MLVETDQPSMHSQTYDMEREEEGMVEEGEVVKDDKADSSNKESPKLFKLIEKYNPRD
jgi:hypothetical protein